MVYGLRILILGLCITSTLTFKADAQQAQLNDNRQQIQRLVQEMKVIQQKLDPLRLQVRQLIVQSKQLSQQMRPLEEKLKVDLGQIRTLRGEHTGN